MMNEDFLHYVWKFQLFDKTELRASSGEFIEIVRQGEHNHDSGPDFFNAQIRVNGILWAGNVEIHVHSSDWNKHKHQADKAYDNVVLHVVLNNDAENHMLRVQPRNTKGDAIPEIELKFRIFPEVQKNYELLLKQPKSFPCSGLIKNVKPHVSSMWLERMAIERMEEKMKDLEEMLAYCANDWDVVCYHLLAKNFGFKINSEAFLALARALPLSVLQKHSNDLFQIESLLFGQAGLLDEYYEDVYAQKLQNEYAFLKKKYMLVPVKKESWKYLRMRPVNFPTIRIAQFAALVYKRPRLFSFFLETKGREAMELFNVTASENWNERYSFTSSSRSKQKTLGREAAENLLVNTVAPLLFFYGRRKNEIHFCDKALELMAAVSPENNKVVREYQLYGLKANSALQTQGMLHMQKKYCSRSSCLNCSIGNNLIKG